MLPVVLVLVAAGGGLAWANSRTAAPTYRTAIVTRADVQQLVNLTGSTHQVSQAKASFPAGGTVTGVAVQVGDSVAKGQPLARIDAVPLQRAVVAATATLARAQATLATDETTPIKTTPGSSRSSTAPTASATPASRSHSSTRPGNASGAGASAVLLAQAQQAVLAASQACATVTPSPNAVSPTPTLTASPNGSGPATASPSSPPRVRSSHPAASDCTSALQTALAAEQRVFQAEATAQKAVQSTAVSTSAALATVVHTAAANPSTRSTTAPCLPAGGQGGGGGMSTAARITTDTAAISAAQVALNLARRNVAGATLLAPLAGKVATQPFAVGSRSGNNAILIVAPGAAQVTVNVPETQRAELKVGQPAVITTDGSTTSAKGTVMQIGLLPTSSSNSSATTYPVLIQVHQPGTGFVEGGTAAVAITVKVVHNVLTVPNSALSDSSMTVLAAGKTTVVAVQTGVVGALRSEITSGAKAGEQVVLADLSATLPANSTATTRNFGGRADRFPGAGRGAVTRRRPGG